MDERVWLCLQMAPRQPRMVRRARTRASPAAASTASAAPPRRRSQQAPMTAMAQRAPRPAGAAAGAAQLLLRGACHAWAGATRRATETPGQARPRPLCMATLPCLGQLVPPVASRPVDANMLMTHTCCLLQAAKRARTPPRRSARERKQVSMAEARGSGSSEDDNSASEGEDASGASEPEGSDDGAEPITLDDDEGNDDFAEAQPAAR